MSLTATLRSSIPRNNEGAKCGKECISEHGVLAFQEGNSCRAEAIKGFEGSMAVQKANAT